MILSVSSFSSFIETVIAKAKGIDVINTIIPSSSLLPTFGSRSLYLNMPKSRRDLFDISIVNVAVGYVTSSILMIIGIMLSSQASSAELLTYTTIPVSLFKCNNIVGLYMNYQFPGILSDGNSVGDIIHMHWLAIVGTVSFIATSLQLLPVDNSNGSKITFAYFGIQEYEIFDNVVNLIKFVILIPVIITSFGDQINGSNIIVDMNKLVIDFLLISGLVNENYNQVCIYNINGLDSRRKVIFYGIVVFAIIQFIPIEYIDRIIATSSMLINGNMNIFPYIILL
jgi:hypothetical protein